MIFKICHFLLYFCHFCNFLIIFFLDQIALVNEFSFSDVLCLIAPEMQVQGFVILTPGRNNTIEACKANLDLGEWKLAEGSMRSQNEDEEI